MAKMVSFAASSFTKIHQEYSIWTEYSKHNFGRCGEIRLVHSSNGQYMYVELGSLSSFFVNHMCPFYWVDLLFLWFEHVCSWPNRLNSSDFYIGKAGILKIIDAPFTVWVCDYWPIAVNFCLSIEISVDAIMNIKAVYQIKRNWMGDPCLPVNYSWNGLNCSYPDSSAPTIISLWVSIKMIA